MGAKQTPLKKAIRQNNSRRSNRSNPLEKDTNNDKSVPKVPKITTNKLAPNSPITVVIISISKVEKAPPITEMIEDIDAKA